MIIWLDNPLNYCYLRETYRVSCSPRFPVKTIGRGNLEFGKLIGYEQISSTLHSDGVKTYDYNYYWLKKHDRDLSPDDVYKGPDHFGGKMPNEAVNPIELVKITPYQEVTE